MTRIQLIKAAGRLVLYARRVEKGVQSLDLRDHQEALANVAEVHELAQRLFDGLTKYLNGTD